VAVVRLPKSGGVVIRPPPARKAARAARARDYFYGARSELAPHSRTVGFSELREYRVGGGPRAPSSALPIGARACAAAALPLGAAAAAAPSTAAAS